MPGRNNHNKIISPCKKNKLPDSNCYHDKKKMSYQAIVWPIILIQKYLEAFCPPLFFSQFLTHLKIMQWFLLGDCMVLGFSTCPHFPFTPFLCPIWQSRLPLEHLCHLYVVMFWGFTFIPVVCLLMINVLNQNCDWIRINSSSISNTYSLTYPQIQLLSHINSITNVLAWLSKCLECSLCWTSCDLWELRSKNNIKTRLMCRLLYRVILEERSIFWDVIVSVTVRKKVHVNMQLLLNS
jgi:hypothetical protein